MDIVMYSLIYEVEGDTGTVKKCLNRVTSKEGNVFYTVKGRGVRRSSRKFRLNAIFDSDTLSWVLISEVSHSYL